MSDGTVARARTATLRRVRGAFAARHECMTNTVDRCIARFNRDFTELTRLRRTIAVCAVGVG